MRRSRPGRHGVDEPRIKPRLHRPYDLVARTVRLVQMSRRAYGSNRCYDKIATALSEGRSQGRATMNLTGDQKKTVAAAFLGWMLDAFDFFLLTFLLKDIAKAVAILS